MPVNQPPAQPSLVEAANTLTVEDLKWYLGVAKERLPTRKGELIALYVETFTTIESVRRLWNELTLQQQQVVAEVAYTADGRLNSPLLEAKYPGFALPRSSQGFETYWTSGRGNEKRTAKPYDAFFIRTYDDIYMPKELAGVVRVLTAKPGPFMLKSSKETPTIKLPRGREEEPELYLSATERAVFHDLAATLFLVQEGKATISLTTKAPTLATVRALRQRLLLGEYLGESYARIDEASRTFALLMLVQAARWAAPTSQGTKLELTRAGEALLYSPLGPSHVREAWERWIATDLVDELGRIRAIKGQQSKDTKLTKPATRRKQIALSLEDCPVGRWISMDEYLRYLRAVGKLPAVERTTNSVLHLGSSGEYGWLGYSDVNYWDIVNGSYVRAFLWEYAATLGIIEIAYTEPEESVHDFGNAWGLDDEPYVSRYDGLIAFQITPLGAYVLGLEKEYTPPEEDRTSGPAVLAVLPNLDVVVVDRVRFAYGDRAILERIGVSQSADVYHLQRDQMLDALEHGLTLDQIRVFLLSRGNLTDETLPQTVRVFFDEVERRANALRDGGRMSIIEGDDPLLLTELAHSTELRASVRLATIGERTVLLVPEEREAAVRRGLRKLGYLPRKSGS